MTFTETFTGALNINGGATYAFTATAGGTVTATLTTVDAGATVAVGLSLGTWNGSACQVVIANDDAAAGRHRYRTVTAAATCARGSTTSGKVTAALNYTITVVRPSLTGTD